MAQMHHYRQVKLAQIFSVFDISNSRKLMRVCVCVCVGMPKYVWVDALVCVCMCVCIGVFFSFQTKVFCTTDFLWDIPIHGDNELWLCDKGLSENLLAQVETVSLKIHCHRISILVTKKIGQTTTLKVVSKIWTRNKSLSCKFYRCTFIFCFFSKIWLCLLIVKL